MLDLAIIGGGPAGLSAGLYATRGGLKEVVMFEKGMPGGQITSSSELENYPGVAEVKSGFDFMIPWQEQCFRFGLKHEMKEVKRVERKDKHFVVIFNDDSSVEAKSVIVATGGSPKRSGINGEDTYWGKGVSSCATCDGFFYKNKEVAVLGGGDTALEESIHLAKICSKVTLIHRRNEFRASPVTVERLKKESKIEVLTPYEITEICGDNSGVNGLKIKNLENGNQSELSIAGIFVLIGYNINNSVLQQTDGSMLCEVNQYGNAKVNLKMETNVPGLFIAGDLREDSPKQVVCAASDGAIAALSVLEYIEHTK
ncbi:MULTISPECIES: thioredoxin-disulfide reductase [Helicobacter]|uniref:Thioredoxin reductase n=1 Tax=Helicobacter ibis TaxID=2962633 RepID=A0ABT4VEB7_9HELI|nr:MULTISPECIES: thioredoxin-disulfide reductase [Helicobacter]MDA3967513.1 thioredoxin-disulfide reductase [Helicobacter sp. WB40]MDA3969047.1 thioredoxin-disulfide reductase [Helicobacter ibis]